MRRFEHPSGRSWSIEQADKQLVIVDAGKSATKKFISAQHAEAALAKFVAAQLAEGFVEVSADAAPIQRRDNDGMDPTLVAQLVDDPYDANLFEVLADALSEKDDPRGELCMRMRAAEAKTSKKLRGAVTAWMKENEDELIGGLADWLELGAYDEPPLVWRHGFIAIASLVNPSPRELAELLRHPSARFLAELEIRGMTPELVGPLVDAPRSLRSIELHARCNLGSLAPLWPALPRLRRLRVHARDFTVGELALPNVERIELFAKVLSGEVVRALSTAKLPELQRLALRIGGFRAYQYDEVRGDAAVAVSDLRALLAREDLGRLTHLRVIRGYASEIAMELAQRPLAGQLVQLDLSGGTLDDASALAMVKAKTFAKLKELIVVESSLTARGIQALQAMTTVIDAKSGVSLGDELDTFEEIREWPTGGDDEVDDDDRYDEIEE